MIISSSFSYLFFHWRCFVIPPVLYRSASPFRGVSIIPAVFRYSGGVPLCRRCFVVPRVFRFPVFRGCCVVPVVFRCFGVVSSFRGCSVFRVPVFRWCSVVPALFRCFTGVPCSGVPYFIVCLKKWFVP